MKLLQCKVSFSGHFLLSRGISSFIRAVIDCFFVYSMCGLQVLLVLSRAMDQINQTWSSLFDNISSMSRFSANIGSCSTHTTRLIATSLCRTPRIMSIMDNYKNQVLRKFVSFKLVWPRPLQSLKDSVSTLFIRSCIVMQSARKCLPAGNKNHMVLFR